MLIDLENLGRISKLHASMQRRKGGREREASFRRILSSRVGPLAGVQFSDEKKERERGREMEKAPFVHFFHPHEKRARKKARERERDLSNPFFLYSF